jgi:hypothetical protein
MIFRLIEAEKAEHAISRLCGVLGVMRAGYYPWRQRGPSRRALGDAELASVIRRVFVASLETYGAPRIADGPGAFRPAHLRGHSRTLAQGSVLLTECTIGDARSVRAAVPKDACQPHRRR